MNEKPTRAELEKQIRKLKRRTLALKRRAGREEERYRTIFEYTGNATVLIAEDTTIVLANSNFARLVGRRREDIEGRISWTSFIVSEDLPRMRKYHDLRRTDPESAPSVYEFRLKTQTGEIRHIHLTVALLPGTRESVASCMDVTESRRAQESLQKSEELYRTIFEHTATANAIIDENGVVVLVNSNFEKITGYARREVERKMPWTAFIFEDDLAQMQERHRLRKSDPSRAPDRYEIRALARSGEVKSFFMSVALIPGTKSTVASLIDVSDRRRAEDALCQSEERFRDMARLLPETVYEADLTGRIAFINESSLPRFGFDREDVDRGICFCDILAPEDRDRARVNFFKVLAGEDLGLTAYTARKKDGATFPALAHSTCILRDGRPAGIRGFLVDISDKKNMEEQLLRAQKMEAVGTLAGGIAHDFNNLLMGILGNVSLLLDRMEEDHPFYERLKSMEAYVQKGSDLTRQLLGFARGGKYELRATNLGKFVVRSSEMFGRTRKEIRIRHSIAEGLEYVDVDRGQMDQVLLNLFVNAWQAMPGGGELSIAVANAAIGRKEAEALGIAPGKYVRLTVSDTGIGMDEDVQSRIFEPFFSTRERGRGTGLGLASVYGIIKNHSGAVTVKSKKRVGTSFDIYLPASAKKAEEETPQAAMLQRGCERILIIDDEEMIVNVGAQMLRRLGYTVETAVGGRSGLRIFEAQRGAFDLVILDMIMPDLGGGETFEALARLKPSVKVLLSSGYSLNGQARDILERGCRGFIQKPFTLAELSGKVRGILEKTEEKACGEKRPGAGGKPRLPGRRSLPRDSF
ncbi:MAG: PAS domain S-box protein [Syntrophaceae bacterium]|nr:PAS domain S-box protein [Syntrophaceae bacterium]